MSTPLNVAVDIIREISAASSTHSSLDVTLCAARLYERHPGTGYSSREIAETLLAEASAAGVLTTCGENRLAD